MHAPPMHASMLDVRTLLICDGRGKPHGRRQCGLRKVRGRAGHPVGVCWERVTDDRSCVGQDEYSGGRARRRRKKPTRYACVRLFEFHAGMLCSLGRASGMHPSCLAHRSRRD